MKRTLAIIATLGLSTAVSGCLFSSEDSPAPVAQTQTQVGPAWKVALTSKCAGEANNCVAAYGFTITADGKFISGPAPAGQISTGALTEEEFKAFSDRVAALSTAAASSSDESGAATTADCQVLAQADSEDDLVLTREGKDKPLVKTKGTEICFQTANREAAAELHSAIKELAAKYYTLPFPNACADQLKALEGMYATVQSCSTDTDCIFVDQDFNAIPPASDQFITTDACVAVKPLVVASNSSLTTQKQALLAAMTSTLSSCGLTAADLTQRSCDGFMSTSAKMTAHCDVQKKMCAVAAPAAPQPETPAGPSTPADSTPANGPGDATPAPGGTTPAPGHH